MSPFPGREALQPERTALAWQRTSLTALALILPLIVLAVRLRMWALAVLGLAAGTMACILVFGVHRRYGELHDDDRGYSPLMPISSVAAVTMMGGLGGVALGLAVWLR